MKFRIEIATEAPTPVLAEAIADNIRSTLAIDGTPCEITVKRRRTARKAEDVSQPE